jgi:hypothetical protein
VLIASTILAIGVLGAVTGILFVTRMSLAARQDMIVAGLLNREVELIRAAPSYEALGNPGMAGPHPTNPVYAERSFTEPQVRIADPQFPDSAPQFTIEYTWYGFGEATGGASNRLTFDQSGWPTGVDFTGNYLILRQGPGAGQMTLITDHAEGQFDLDAAVNGYGISELLVPPAAGTRFEVDGGKWVRVTARWQSTPNEDERAAERVLFISNRFLGQD